MKKLLAIYFLTTLSAWAVEPNFTSIEKGDRIEITRRSHGCFHDTTFYYEVRKIADTCLFTEYAITWDKIKTGVMTEKMVIGRVQLTQKDLEDLDGFLRYYRGEKNGNSTTVNTLGVEYFEGGKRIKIENLKDESGSYGVIEATFFELIKRLHGLSH